MCAHLKTCFNTLIFVATETESTDPSRATNTSSSSVSLAAISAPPETSTLAQMETTATAGAVTATPLPACPLTPPDNSSTNLFQKKVQLAKANIEILGEKFSDIKFEVQESLSQREKQDSSFLRRFQTHLLDMPCTKKQVHIQFFVKNETEILESNTIQKLFIILGRHCNYTNYEIILHIVKRFCKQLTQQILSYRDSLVVFEKATTVDVFLCAISAPPGGKISAGFRRMTMKINKPASECTLHEIRELKESIEEEAELESYAVYIDTPGPGSVCVRLCIPERVGWRVGVVLTSKFRQKHLLSEVTVEFIMKEWSLAQYLVRNYTLRFCKNTLE